MKELINRHVNEHLEVANTLNLLISDIQKVASIMIDALKNGKTIFWCGNGGSASDSQHLAGELIGRYVGDRKPLKSIALNADSAVMTCIVNDYGYDEIFSRQVEGLASEGDVLIGISTSGNSQNILNALKVANIKKLHTIAFLGKGGGLALDLAEESILVNSNSTARVQEMHITIGHILCDLIEDGLNLKT